MIDIQASLGELSQRVNVMTRYSLILMMMLVELKRNLNYLHILGLKTSLTLLKKPFHHLLTMTSKQMTETGYLLHAN